MLPVVRDLLVLQDRDQRIRSLSRDLKEIPNLKKRAESRLEDDTAAVTTTLGKVREIELKIKTLQLDAQTRRTSITRLKDQQFATRKNEEFRALAHEVERYEKDVTTLEDQELELMEALENVRPAYNEALAQQAETKKGVEEELTQMAERAAALETRITELKTERAQLSAPIEPGALGLYDRLMKSKGDAAVVQLQDGNCGGCHVRVVSGTVQSLKADESITQCEQCGRILHKEVWDGN